MGDWIAVTGGCGYIGSHIACELKSKTDHRVLIIDRAAGQLPHTHWLADQLVEDDVMGDRSRQALLDLRPKAIIHCAGTSLVGPSITDPGEYYRNNVAKTIDLLDLMVTNGLGNLIFSSSAAVYGESWAMSCDEEQDINPINPYGNTKAMIETVLRDYGTAYKLSSMSFRYFNAAGADPMGRLGQQPGATHLVAKIMENLAYGKQLVIYGDRYPTRDGTCIRDYAHVCDIARAHVLAINHLYRNPSTYIYNIGSGTGTTTFEMIQAAGRVIGRLPTYTVGDVRPGDPAILIAVTDRVHTDLKWHPNHTIDDMIKSAWDWYNGSIYGQLLSDQ
jgi:UDP-glucose 4-epimerase